MATFSPRLEGFYARAGRVLANDGKDEKLVDEIKEVRTGLGSNETDYTKKFDNLVYALLAKSASNQCGELIQLMSELFAALSPDPAKWTFEQRLEIHTLRSKCKVFGAEFEKLPKTDPGLIAALSGAKHYVTKLFELQTDPDT